MRRTAGWAVVGLLLLAACTAKTTTVTAAPSESTPPPAGTDSPTETPSPKKTPARQRPEVRGTFSDYDWIIGKRLGIAAAKIQHDNDCTVHTYTVKGKTRAAFQSDCHSWESDGYDVLIFYLALKNVRDRGAGFNLRNFVLVTRDGRSFGPVNVRSKAETPPNFLPETGKIPPHTSVFGYLTFDGRATGVVPARLSYIDGDQTLTVVFDGRPGVE